MQEKVQEYHFEHVVIIFLILVLVVLIGSILKNSSTPVQEGKFLVPTQLLEQPSQVLSAHTQNFK